MSAKQYFNWEYYNVPEHTQEALANYFVHRYEPGSFLMSVLCNDLAGAATRADHINRNHLADIIKWVLHNAPNGSWGNRETVMEWLGGSEAQQYFEKKTVTRILKGEVYE